MQPTWSRSRTRSAIASTENPCGRSVARHFSALVVARNWPAASIAARVRSASVLSKARASRTLSYPTEWRPQAPSGNKDTGDAGSRFELRQLYDSLVPEVVRFEHQVLKE